MGDFDSFWDRAIGTLDVAVDDILGDRILYAIDGLNYEKMAAFIVFIDAGQTGMDELDLLQARKRVKIAKHLVPDPGPRDRLQHPKLGGGIFQPGTDSPDEDGRYWIFDVQKASA